MKKTASPNPDSTFVSVYRSFSFGLLLHQYYRENHCKQEMNFKNQAQKCWNSIQRPLWQNKSCETDPAR